MVLVSLGLGLGILTWTGCSGTSGGVDPVFPLPPITGVTFRGSVDLSDVGVHTSLGGYYHSIKAGFLAAIIDYSHFKIAVEDDPSGIGEVGQDGKFSLSELSVREQAVLRFTSSRYPGFVLEWMGVDLRGLWGSREIRVTIRTTARSIVARMLRNRYGRLLDPEQITDGEIKPVVDALIDILEVHPEKISSGAPLDRVAEVVAAAGKVADALEVGNRGAFPREWSILVYQGGDNNLDLALKSDLEEMIKIGPPEKSVLLVQSDRPPTGIRRLLIAKGKEQVLANVGQGNSADPLYLGDFVAWSQRAFPARRFSLFVASHGLGWRGEPVSRGVITDEPDRATMDLLSFSGAVTAAITTPGPFVRPIDLIGFDACLMGLVEIAYQLRACGKFLIFSQANEPSYGWPYDLLLSRMASRSAALDGEGLGKLVCGAYEDYFVNEGLASRYSGTLSLINLAQMDNLKLRFLDWAAVLYRDRETIGSALRGLRDGLFATPVGFSGTERYLVQAFEFIDYRDLADLVQNCRSSVPQANVAADHLMTAFSQTVLTTVRFGERYSRAHGLSIAFPGPGDIADYVGASFYPMFDLSRETVWDDLFTDLALASAAGRVDGRNLAIELEWSSGADLDLLLGEPDPQPLAGNAQTVWYSPAEGPATPNGRFSLDSAKSGLNEESWLAEQSVLPGRYLVSGRMFSGSKITTPTIGRLKISTIATEATFLSPGLHPGEIFNAAIIDITAGNISIAAVPETAPPD